MKNLSSLGHTKCTTHIVHACFLFYIKQLAMLESKILFTGITYIPKPWIYKYMSVSIKLYKSTDIYV